MPKYNFTNLVMPIDLEKKDNGIELTFADAKAATDFKLSLPNFNGKNEDTKILIPNTYINSLKNKTYIDELIAYYNKRGKDNKKEVTLACIVIAFFNWDLQKTIDSYLPNTDERQAFLAQALDSTWTAMVNWDTGLGTTVKKFNPTLEEYSKQKTDAKNVLTPKQAIKPADSTDLLKNIAADNAGYEAQHLADNKHVLQTDDQKEVKKQALKLSGVTVTIETGNNKKNPPTPNQDTAGAETFKLPPDSTPATLLTAMQTAIQQTGDQLLTYNNEGTTFTACALARFATGELISTCAHLGDTGALAIGADGQLTLLTANHNTNNEREAKRIATEGCENNILWQVDINNKAIGRYLADGYNFHLLDKLPDPLHPKFTGSYIFISDTETLYYIGAANQKAENITILDIGKFRQVLEQIKKTTLWLKPIDSGWAIASNTNNNAYTAMRLSDKQLNSLIPSVGNSVNTELRALGNCRFFGNGTFNNKGGSYKPECTQVLLGAGCKLVLFSDGVTDKIKLSQIAEFLSSSIRSEAYLRGSKDDITTLIATELDKLPRGIVVLLIMADGHGILGHKISAEAIQKFIINFRAQLSPAQQADAKHATAAADPKSGPTPTVANPASGAAAPAYRP